jgi:hypothetical protein
MRNPKKPGVVGFMTHSMKLSRNLAIPGDVVVGRAGTHTQWEIHGNPEDCHRSIKREAKKCGKATGINLPFGSIWIIPPIYGDFEDGPHFRPSCCRPSPAPWESLLCIEPWPMPTAPTCTRTRGS